MSRNNRIGVENGAFRPNDENVEKTKNPSIESLEIREGISEKKSPGIREGKIDESSTVGRLSHEEKSSQDSPTCGFGRWRPKFLQKLHNPKCLLVSLCCCCVTQGLVVNGLIPVSLSTLERRFNLTSTKSGLFASFYDVAVLLVLALVAHFGGRGHKGQWLGWGMMLMGIGSFICVIPQFSTGIYHYGQEIRDTCVLNGTDGDYCSNISPSLSNYLYVFLLGQLFHGIGASPLYTLGVTYLDENVKQTASGLYVGIYFAFSVLGPAIGYLLGGLLLKIYGDIGKVSLTSVSITPEDPQWYGAWWIGFLLTGTMAIIFGIPLLGFANELPGAKERRKDDVLQANHFGTLANQIPTGDSGLIMDSEKENSWKVIAKEYWDLLKNPTFDCLTAIQCTEAFILNGFSAFLPKVIENLFNYSSSWASMLTGAIVIPGGFFGNVLGGYLIKRYKLLCPGMLVTALICQVISLLMLFTFFVHCPDPLFAGVNVGYDGSQHGSHFGSQDGSAKNPGSWAAGSPTLNHSCNSGCSCSRFFQPVCYEPLNLMYFSSCRAGCMTKTLEDGKTIFTDCTCILEYHNATIIDAKAEPGLCSKNCGLIIYMFFICVIIFVFATFISAMPIQQAQLRCVRFEQRSLAIGVNWIFARLLGAIPGVILFGVAIDRACILWQSDCGQEGSCGRYESRSMSLYLMGISIGIKTIGCVSLALGKKLYHAPVISDSQANLVNANRMEIGAIGTDNPAFNGI